ncbi:MAG: polysaccharide deacetylase family protein [Acidobacteriota bacterium]|nr:polysaccharide deacetylase family protein [Acidobacteriota bacterium]
MKKRLLGSAMMFMITAGAACAQMSTPQTTPPQPAPHAASGPSVQERLGYPANSRLLIIHADDFGMSHSVNRATFEALENGWVTSASIMVPCPWFPEVVQWAKRHPDADLGIHMVLNSEWTPYRWGPLSPTSTVPTLLDQHGYFPLLESDVPPKADLAQVEVEIRAQIEKARAEGIKLSHLDTHMTTLTRSPALFEVYRRVGRAYGLPILLERGEGTYRQAGQPLPPEALIDKVVSMDVGVPLKRDAWLDASKRMLQPLGPGVYEFIVHPGYDDPEMQGATFDHPNWGATWRQLDLETVKSKEFRDFLRDEKFIIVRWRDLARALPNAQPAAATGGH